MYRILVTGSREFTARHLILEVLKQHAHLGKQAVVVHGGQGDRDRDLGADMIADRVARALGMTVEPYPADWQHCVPDCSRGHRRRGRNGVMYCPTAGHRRNQEMVDLGADVCEAFPREGAGNQGTQDCIRRAEKAGIAVYVTLQEGP